MSAPWLLDMVWRDVCFAHWRADPERLERALPAGVDLDRYDGAAWLSIVPFRMTGVRARALPVLPGFADVGEINLRTYVRVGGRAGVWFFSLDAASPAVVRGARIVTGLPYFDARIGWREDGTGISYESERTHRGCRPGRFAARYRPPAHEWPVERDSLEAFLHERYRFFNMRGTTLVTGEVRHQPWTLGPIAPEIDANSLGDLIDHPLAGAPDRAYFARVQPVRAGAVVLAR